MAELVDGTGKTRRQLQREMERELIATGTDPTIAAEMAAVHASQFDLIMVTGPEDGKRVR